jgi:CHAD domain-containing protein
VESIVERELKLDLDASFRLPELIGDAIAERRFTSIYYDTPPRSLARAGITLRQRIEDGVTRWQLKLPRAGPSRTELESAAQTEALPEDMHALLVAHLRHGALERVAALETRRHGVRVRDGEHAVAEVTVDHVAVVNGSRATERFSELEIELLDGDEDDLSRLERVLLGAGARPSDGRPKVMRVLEVPREAPLAQRPVASEQVAHLLRRQLAQLEAHDPGVRVGVEAEDVHRFRVATRRTRELIRATRPVLGDALAPLRGELRWLAGVVGPVRDLDVLLARLRPEVELLDSDRDGGESVLGALSDERGTRREELLAALASERYVVLLVAFESAVASLPRRDGDLRDVAAATMRRLRRAAEKLPESPPDAELHALRIRAKRARYAAELAGLGGDKKTARLVDALKTLQDVIGEHQDAVVAEERLRALERPSAALAVGRLVERERARKREMRTLYPDALATALRRGRKALG